MTIPTISPNLNMVEDAFRKAEIAAAQFFQTLLKRSVLVREKNDFEKRNHGLFSIDDVNRFSQKVAIPFYFSAGIVQSIFLYQMLDSTFFADVQDGQFWYTLLCILAGIAPIGCSLWAGTCFLHIQPKEDPVVAGRLHFHSGWLAAFIIISVVYLGFVVLLTKFNSKPGEYDLIIVPVLAVIELILGVPAVEGLNSMVLFSTKKRHIKSLLDNSTSMLKWAGKCARAYRHYMYYRILFNKQHPEAQLGLLTSPQIERAIQYFNGYWDSESISLTVGNE